MSNLAALVGAANTTREETIIATSPTKLAIDGGPAVFPEGPPPWPLPDDDVFAALQSAYQNGDWGRYHGPHVERLGQELADLLGTSCGCLTTTGKMCTRPLASCKQHSNAQRAHLRQLLFASGKGDAQTATIVKRANGQIDVFGKT